MKTIVKNNYELLIFFFLIFIFLLLAYYRVNQLNRNTNYNLSNHKIIVNH